MFSHTSIFRNISCTIINSLRTYAIKPPEPIQYHGFKYYPRHENFKDPPYEPSKLFLVIRTKKARRITPAEKKALALLNIDGDRRRGGHVNIVKNIPEINEKLWIVKHIVEIKPITWKGELPKDGDFTGTYLRKTGEFIISPKLKTSEEVLKASEEYNNRNDSIRKYYMKDHLRKKWIGDFSITPL